MEFSVDLKFHSYVTSLPLILEMSTTLVTMYKTIYRFYSQLKGVKGFTMRYGKCITHKTTFRGLTYYVSTDVAIYVLTQSPIWATQACRSH